MVINTQYGHIEIDYVSKYFVDPFGNKVLTVNDVTIDIKPGEFVCLMGPSGCGKTTLLRTIAGLLKADEGTIHLDNDLIEKPGPERGLVFQNPELFKWMSVEENVAFGLKARGVYKEQKDDVQKFIDLVGLKGFEKTLPHHLSGGMQQRAAFARALINRPKVLLLDEPFGALDAFTRTALQNRLVDLWKRFGMTCVMVTHDVEEAVVLATKIVVMSSRPATVIDIVENDLSYPRDRNSMHAIELKKQILEQLHSGEFSDEETYSDGIE